MRLPASHRSSARSRRDAPCRRLRVRTSAPSSRIVCPPARSAPAARTCSSAAPNTAASTSFGSSSGNAAIESASNGSAAHREDVVQRIRRCDAAECRGVVDERREEVEREDDRAVVVELVDDCVVRRCEADEKVLGLHRHEALQQLFQPRRGVLRGAAAAGGRSVSFTDRTRTSSYEDGSRAAAFSSGRGRVRRIARTVRLPIGALHFLYRRTRGTRGDRHRRVVGIGLAIGRMLRDEGFGLTLASRRPRRCRRRPTSSAPRGRRRRREARDCERLVAEHGERFGRLDMLVNSAGIGIAGRVEDAAGEALRPAGGRQPARTLLRDAGGDPAAPRVERLDRQPRVDRGHAADARARDLRRDEGGGDLAHAVAERGVDADGVRAIAICPGFVDTPMAQWSGLTARR